jgi:hypothetical protein
MLTEEFIRQTIESIRSGEAPEEFLPENLLLSFGEEKFENVLLNVIEDIWFPIGDKAYIRLGYHDAVSQLNKFVYPSRYKAKEESLATFPLDVKDYFF